MLPLPLPLLLLLSCSPVRLATQVVEAAARNEGLVERRVVLGSRQVRVWVGGEGPPLVLLHGFGGDGLLTWNRQVEELRQHRTLIIPDLLWFGDSFALGPTPSLELQARTMWETVDQLGYEQVELAGISYGGFVAMLMHQLDPARVQSLVIVDSPGPVFEPQDVQAMLDRLGINSAEQMFVPQTPEDVARLIAIVRPGGPPIPRPILVDIKERHFSRNHDEHRALLADLTGLHGAFPASAWKKPARGLVIWGEEDPVFPVESGRELAQVMGMELTVMEGLAHGPNFQRAGEFNSILLDFLVGEDR